MSRFFVCALLVAAGAASAAIGACNVGELDLENRGCPCGAGYLCDAARDVCVQAEALLDGAVFVEAGSEAGTFEAGSQVPPCRGPDCACATEPDCTDPAYPKCVDAKCVACTTSPDSCAIGSYCLPSHECAPGCKTSSECAALSPTAPFCNTERHQCVQCTPAGGCMGTLQCSPAGACVTTCVGQGTTCADGTSTCCNGLCIDTKSDPLNCNACSAACTGATTLCCAAQCTNPLTSTGNCGQCGAACNSTTHATASSCAAGACGFSCVSGYGHCVTGNTGCETSTTSVSACGSCANNCNLLVKNATGITCQANKCGYTACNAGFYELDGNLADGCEPCGMNGQYCCPGNICNGGSHCEIAPANDGKCH